MVKKVLGSLVVLGVMVSGVTGLQAMGSISDKTQAGEQIGTKTKGVEMTKTKGTDSSQKVLHQPKSDSKKGVSKKDTKLKEIEHWKTYTSDIGSYEIKYPPEWKFEVSYLRDSFKEEKIKEELVTITCFPSGYSTYSEARKSKTEHIHIAIDYSDIETVPYYLTKEEINIEKKKSPEKIFSLGNLTFLKKTTKDNTTLFYSYIEANKKYYHIVTRIFDPFNKGYENLVKQILSTFKIRGDK